MGATTSPPSPSPSQSMAEIARARLREARARVRHDEQQKHKAENDKALKWREFSDTFYTCGPTKLALAAGVTSSAPKQQTPFILANERQLRAVEARSRVVEAAGDPSILRVAALQTEEGRWEPSLALTAALGGLVPAPPEGVVGWRWSTACAMAFLRRRPDQFAFTQEAHDKGLPWLKPAWLKAAARATLPPHPPYFELDPASVRAGRWRDSEGLVFARRGVQGFRAAPPSPATPPRRPAAVLLGGDDPPRTSSKGRAPSAALVVDAKRFAAHQRRLRDEFAALTKQSCAGLRRRNVEELTAVWAAPCGMQAERNRLELSRRVPNAGVSWDSSGARRSSSDARPRLSRARARALPARAPAEFAWRRAGEESEVEASSEEGDEEESGGGQLSDGGDYDAAARELEAARRHVVASCARYDAYREELGAAAARGTEVWKAARLNNERIVAYAQLTEMLGPHQPARRGFADWRGQAVRGMQSVTLALVEAVGRWRAAKQAHDDDAAPTAAAAAAPRLPFVWNGQNALLAVSAGLDFLGRRYPEIGEWFGAEYAFVRNPFGRASPVDARPATPPSAKMAILVDGELVEKVNPRLLAAHEAAQRAVAAHQAKAQNAPRWWPAQGDQRHQDRMRAAEKELLAEEAAFGQLRDAPRTGSAPHGALRGR